MAILRAGADVLEERKWDVSVACLVEVGKSRLEAVGEVEEAIDLIRHYCDEMERTDGFREDRPGASSAERCSVVLRPYGVFGVIAPFNFPVALSVGMISAALVAGNTVVFKPSDAAGLTGRLIVEALVEGGVPDGVLNLVYGGRETGEALGAPPPRRRHCLHRIERGRHDALPRFCVVDRDAASARRDGREEPGVRHRKRGPGRGRDGRGAIGVRLSGQKCSALSKVYVARPIMEDFLDALIETANKLKVGDPRSKDVFTGPVIDEAARDRFVAASAEAAEAGSMVLGGAPLSGDPFDRGPYVAPTIVRGLQPDHRINRDELFVPFLSVLPLDELDTAIADANRSAFGLTAGIYTRDQAELDRFLDTIEAGVLYANRASGATTGAWPGFQTFCGWKGSGTTGKGGLGSWYVPQFMREQSRTIFETA